jgi:DNA-binding MarR family transcriptional regulator
MPGAKDHPGTSTDGAARLGLLKESLFGLEELTARHSRQGTKGSWARLDLPKGQVHVLILLHESGPATVGHLADALGVSLPSASCTVDRLEEHRLALRQRDDADRRVVHVTLTTKGRAAAEEAAGFRRQRVRQLLDHFNADELRALLKVLAAVRRCFDESV